MFILNVKEKEWYVEVVEICKIYMQNCKEKETHIILEPHLH